jgi:hypothetical protein
MKARSDQSLPIPIMGKITNAAARLWYLRTTGRFGSRFRFRTSLPQRGWVHQPRVAACPLPWVVGNPFINPNGVVAPRSMWLPQDATPSGLGRFDTCSQGRPSFLRPTLGFGTQSRWDTVEPIAGSTSELQSKARGELKKKLRWVNDFPNIIPVEIGGGI